MVTVYGTDWCEDTQRSLRYLRRLAVEHEYFDVDEDPAALTRAKALNHGRRRTPIVQVQGEVLVEPGNATLTQALLRNGMLDTRQVQARMHRRNVGDLERGIRIGGGVALAALSLKTPRGWRIPVLALGVAETLTGVFGWCPVYSTLGVTSIGGPLDHPMEADRATWLTEQVALASGHTQVGHGADA
ncbi:MAG: YgaP-like transmembrane domain [Bacteroidales bacterium]